jgi:ribosomal-protein-alanine N-acetyltransferase
MSTAPHSNLRFRAMVRSDLPAVVAIERRSFRQPWDREQFLRAIERSGGARACIAEENGRLIGYFALEHQGVNLHLLNLAVHPEHRRRGHGSAILAEVERLCLEELQQGREGDGEPEAEISLEVEESNLAAQLLYRKMGYRATKVLRNFYRALGEDGYKMVRKVTAAPLGTATT